MKPFFSIILSALLVLGCRTKPTPAEPITNHGSPSVPATLENPKSESGLFTKRGSRDLVDELYEEAVANEPALQQLEAAADDWNSRYSDSLQPFQQYNSKNQDYYQSARAHNNRIQDSLLKNRIAALVTNHEAAYAQKTSLYKRLLERIGSGQVSLADQFAALRIIKTLPMIAAYQQGKLPAAKPIESVLSDLEKIIREAEKQAQ